MAGRNVTSAYDVIRIAADRVIEARDRDFYQAAARLLTEAKRLFARCDHGPRNGRLHSSWSSAGNAQGAANDIAMVRDLSTGSEQGARAAVDNRTKVPTTRPPRVLPDEPG